MNEPSLSPVLA